MKMQKEHRVNRLRRERAFYEFSSDEDEEDVEFLGGKMSDEETGPPSAADALERMVAEEAHHIRGVQRDPENSTITCIEWHYAWRFAEGSRGSDPYSKEKDHHVCAQCGRCVLRCVNGNESGPETECGPGGKRRLCLYCAGYDPATIIASYEFAEA